jgi:hypothetical protein
MSRQKLRIRAPNCTDSALFSVEVWSFGRSPVRHRDRLLVARKLLLQTLQPGRGPLSHVHELRRGAVGVDRIALSLMNPPGAHVEVAGFCAIEADP